MHSHVLKANITTFTHKDLPLLTTLAQRWQVSEIGDQLWPFANNVNLAGPRHVLEYGTSTYARRTLRRFALYTAAVSETRILTYSVDGRILVLSWACSPSFCLRTNFRRSKASPALSSSTKKPKPTTLANPAALLLTRSTRLRYGKRSWRSSSQATAGTATMRC